MLQCFEIGFNEFDSMIETKGNALSVYERV